MSKAAYWQRGESLDYVNDTEDVIEAGTIIDLGTMIGVAGTDIVPGDTGSLHVTGVYSIDKTSSSEIAMGTAVYFDGDGITDDSSGTPAGYAAQPAEADDETIFVKLAG